MDQYSYATLILLVIILLWWVLTKRTAARRHARLQEMFTEAPPATPTAPAISAADTVSPQLAQELERLITHYGPQLELLANQRNERQDFPTTPPRGSDRTMALPPGIRSTQIQQDITHLTEKGLSVEETARQLRISRAEVELALQLRLANRR